MESALFVGFYCLPGRFSSFSDPTVVETLPTPRCNIHIMKTPLLALLAAASVALAATTSTNNKKPSGPTPPGGNKTATVEKKPKKEAKAEAPAEAPADPVSLVVQTVDATTQMALDAAKAAQAEADKLAAIGSGKAAAGPSNAKLAEAAVGTGVVIAKELSKP